MTLPCDREKLEVSKIVMDGAVPSALNGLGWHGYLRHPPRPEAIPTALRVGAHSTASGNLAYCTCLRHPGLPCSEVVRRDSLRTGPALARAAASAYLKADRHT